MLAMLELSLVNGYGSLEHPALPDKEEETASIWRLPLMQVLFALPNIALVRLAQGLMGPESAKPTHLLALNLPRLIHHFHAGRIRKDFPTAVSIGRTESGEWRTAPLKEYAPAFCRSIANSLLESFSQDVADPSVEPPPSDFLAQCATLMATEYGSVIGADFAG